MTRPRPRRFLDGLGAHWSEIRLVPWSIVARVCNEIDAGAPIDARLLLADQLRGLADHHRNLGADREAASFLALAALIPVTGEKP